MYQKFFPLNADLIIFFTLTPLFSGGASSPVALGGPKVFPFPVDCLDSRRYHFLASKQGNHSYFHGKNHRDDRASPQNTACVIAEDIPSQSNEVLSASHYVLLGGPSVALQICKGLYHLLLQTNPGLCLTCWSSWMDSKGGFSHKGQGIPFGCISSAQISEHKYTD